MVGERYGSEVMRVGELILPPYLLLHLGEQTLHFVRQHSRADLLGRVVGEPAPEGTSDGELTPLFSCHVANMDEREMLSPLPLTSHQVRQAGELTSGT